MVKLGNKMTAIANAIKKVATGPHLSKNLSVEEAKEAMMEVLSGAADPVQAAVFFIGLRMKTETNEENLGILQAIYEYTEQVDSAIPELLTFADPFNGYDRHCPILAFLPAVLGACGLPTVSQGVMEMGPKFGVTHAQVLAHAGMNTKQSVVSAKLKLENANIAWAYIDQSQASPALYALEDLRTKIIKRPSLATLEKIIMPIKAMTKNHLQVGFVHKAYPNVLAWLAQQAGYDSALIIRGLEGGVLPTLRDISTNYRVQGEQVDELQLDPKAFGIEQTTRGVLPVQSENVTAEETYEIGCRALAGEPGPAYDSLIFGAATNLWHVGRFDSQLDAANYVRDIIDGGKAKAHFEAGIE
jgi:anthranilate phosphoribosyltransferase